MELKKRSDNSLSREYPLFLFYLALHNYCLSLRLIYDKIKLRRQVITLRRGELAFGLQENYTCLEKKLAKHSIYHFCRCHRMPGNRKYVTY